MARRIARQIALSARQQRFAAHEVSTRMMVECHRDLNESLKKLSFGLGRCAPDILEDLVSFEVLTGIEELDAMKKIVGEHAMSVA
jgi:hypothetical protein